MNIDEIINKPITTPEYPDPTEARRYLDDPDGFYGYDYVFLEDATWNALCEIAHERDCTVGELCSDIELNFAPGEPFTPAARHYVMRYLAGIPDNIELPGNFRVLSETARRTPASTTRSRRLRIADARSCLCGDRRPAASPVTPATSMKIVKLQSMGGADKQTAESPADAEKLAAFKRRMQAHTDAIKRHLSKYIERNASPADHVSITTALLELGFERQLDLHGEEDARDLVDRAFRRVVQTRRRDAAMIAKRATVSATQR